MSRAKETSSAKGKPLMQRRRTIPRGEPLTLPKANNETELRQLHADFRQALRDVKQDSLANDARLVADALRMADSLAARVGDDPHGQVWTREYQEARLLANAVLQVSTWTGTRAGKPDADRLHYIKRAMLIGAELQRAGLFAKGSGGRQPGSGKHDNTDIFERAFVMIEVRKLRPMKTVWQSLAQELRRDGRKKGTIEEVANGLAREYRKWRRSLTREQVSILSNQK